MRKSASFDQWSRLHNTLLLILHGLTPGNSVWELRSEDRDVLAAKTIANGVNSFAIGDGIGELLFRTFHYFVQDW